MQTSAGSITPLEKNIKNKSKYKVLFIQNFIRIRYRLGLKQHEMAALLKVTTQKVKDWERYRSFPDYDDLINIGIKLDVKIDEMGRSELLLN